MYFAVHANNGLQQNICTIGNMLVTGKFVGGVTDAVSARHEYHSNGCYMLQTLCVMTGAAGHVHGREIQCIAAILDQRFYSFVGDCCR